MCEIWISHGDESADRPYNFLGCNSSYLLVVCSLFNDAVNNPGYISSNDWIANNETEGI